MKTGIFIRVQVNGKWGAYDIGDGLVSDEQVLEWLRSRGDNNPWAENTVMALLGRRQEVTKRKEVDITRQCRAVLEFSSDGEALVYLFHYEKKIGLFDKNGFHFMAYPNTAEECCIEDGTKVHEGIIWFKVCQRR